MIATGLYNGFDKVMEKALAGKDGLYPRAVFSDDLSSTSAFPGSVHLRVGHVTPVSPQKREMQPVGCCWKPQELPGAGFTWQTVSTGNLGI